MGSSVSRSKNVVDPKVQIKYFKETIARQEQELKESFNKTVSLENERALDRQKLSRCQTDLQLFKQEILYKTKEVSSLEKEIFSIQNPSLQKRVLKIIAIILIGSLDFAAAILYGYAINRITGSPPDKGAEVLILIAFVIYIVGQALQIFKSGVCN